MTDISGDGIVVLSLFDGCSCGQIALKQAGIKVKTYYASEIEKYPMQITMNNFPETVQLGDVRNFRDWNLPKIDLLIGGSPCQGFSFMGTKLNFEHPESKLYFVYKAAKEFFNPLHFLLENVFMHKRHEDVITNDMGINPVKINSRLVTASLRSRNYWTDIGGYTTDMLGNRTSKIPQPPDLKIEVPAIIQEELTEEEYKTLRSKMLAFLADTRVGRKPFSSKPFNVATQKIYWDRGIRKLGIDEIEINANLPVGYTEGVPMSHRTKAIGNGWNVNTLAYIFSHLPDDWHFAPLQYVLPDTKYFRERVYPKIKHIHGVGSIPGVR